MPNYDASSLKAKPLPAAAELHELLQYDPVSGALYWRVSRGRVAAGTEAGHVNNDGYRSVRIMGIRYLAHRLIWKIVTDCDPVDEVDHIDRNRLNNSWINLRAATRSQNFANVAPRSSHLKGAFPEHRTGRWVARIVALGDAFHLGTFNSEIEAHEAYVAAAKLHFGDYARAA